jgi:predicted signal transduction protein with EAL and GGDEF domain
MVKIDRSFVTGLGTGEDRGEIVRSIVELARSLGLDVIAEGVETEGELQRLLGLGCARAQGYYFSKPMEPQAVPALVEVENLKNAFRQLEGRTQEPPQEKQLSAPRATEAEITATQTETLAHSL